MWKSAYVGVYQLLNWKMHGETLKFMFTLLENICCRYIDWKPNRWLVKYKIYN